MYVRHTCNRVVTVAGLESMCVCLCVLMYVCHTGNRVVTVAGLESMCVCLCAHVCMYVTQVIGWSLLLDWSVCVYVCVCSCMYVCHTGNRVVTVAGLECMCGGTHVKNTSDIRTVTATKIKKVRIIT